MKKAAGLQDELTDLRVEFARLEPRSGNVLEPLNPNSLADFIRKEKTPDVKILEEDPSYVVFKIDDEDAHRRRNRGRQRTNHRPCRSAQAG